MTDYKIVGLQNNNIMLEYDGIKRNFPLPIVDGKFPEGEELYSLLQTYVDYQRNNIPPALVAANESVIAALIVAPTIDDLSNKIRMQRNMLLQLTDWTQIADVQLSSELKAIWTIYRNDLRNITSQQTYPINVVWPIPPLQIKNPRGLAVTNLNGTPNTPAIR